MGILSLGGGVARFVCGGVSQSVCESAASGVSSIFSFPVWTLLSSLFPKGSWDWRGNTTNINKNNDAAFTDILDKYNRWQSNSDIKY